MEKNTMNIVIKTKYLEQKSKIIGDGSRTHAKF